MDINLYNWAVWEVRRVPTENFPTRHAVGINGATNDMRVSSPIVGWDPIARMAVTKSGTVYFLNGVPAPDPNKNAMWQSWQVQQHISTALDVTDEYGEG